MAKILGGIAKKKNNLLLISPGHLLTILHQLTKIEATCYTNFRDMCGSRVGTGGPDPPPLESYKNIGFLSNTGLDPIKHHTATKPAFNVWPSLARQLNAISVAFRWSADDCPILVVFGSTHLLKKSWTPSEKTFWIRTCEISLLQVFNV